MLDRAGYGFVTPTPETHRLVNRRAANGRARDLAGVFGWSRPFAPEVVPAGMLQLLRDADALQETKGGLVSRVRFSRLGDLLLAHSAFPTAGADAVFFGPDTYRFARAVAAATRAGPAPQAVVDVGAGTGAGAFVAARRSRRTARLILADINPAALRLAAVNARLNGFERAECRESDVLAGVPEAVPLVLANPPYLVDAGRRLYRHGGGPWGTGLSLRILDEAAARLPPGGRLILYTGTPVVDGVDRFLEAARPRLAAAQLRWSYEEIDPDVFGEELLRPPYDAADRIAAVLLVAARVA